MKRLVILLVLLLATPALAGSYWVEPFGGFSKYNMGILNDRIEGYNNAWNVGLDTIGSGAQFGLIFGHDMDSAPGTVGIIVENFNRKLSGGRTFRTVAGADSVAYNVAVEVPALAVRGFLMGRLPSLFGDKVTSSLGWSVGLMRTTGKVSWKRTDTVPNNEPPPDFNQVVTEATADMGSSSLIMDWFMNSTVRFTERLNVAVDLGWRMAPSSKKTVAGTPIDGSYAVEYGGPFARVGLLYRLRL
jgi:hypothetical protein